ncbi:hypothetical protein G3480_02445 [Thiorhodococcus mannitoliphagus]|uniref:Uncharacterized protein n=1 Tax=Thiorhodococcus mannitoliphagus TaxID=329406 RepID=A0A6P1DQH8_9GAMM|nr:hypothetical protein [Thiorhodococcus mannitoliphagus]NEX19181.1 hypothetical protein [Thiorhodococcus mannitoliphagus]
MRRFVLTGRQASKTIKASLSDPNVQEGVWADTSAEAIDETGLDLFAENCP